MLFLGILLVICAIACLTLALGLWGTSSRAVRERLGVAVSAGAKDEAGRTSLFANSELGIGRFLAPPGLAARAERNLLLAGRPPGWTLKRILTAKVWFIGAAVVFAFVMVQASSSLLVLLMAIGAIVLGYFIPDLLIMSRAQERQQLMQHELPDTLDQVTVSIESGLSFEAAIARSGDSGKGPLSEELVRTVQDIRLGMSRRDAYVALSERTTVEDLKRFTRSIVQAEEFGIPISNIVRTQAQEMRIKRRLRAEGKAAKVPTKMLFPLISLILPVLFIVVLAPAIMNAADTFGNR